ncbi:hypothetical protein acdb102_08890 [Acidothermaceae bacterium B102]|nr:hypothetical protein acdb102_08890 [Acidothermaceae bacterium B102]
MKTASARAYDLRTGSFVDAQSAVVTRRQLAAVGIGPSQVRNQVQAGRWSLEGNRVVILHNGPLTAEQQRWAAVLGQTHTAALGGITAAQAHGLNWLAEEQLHVLVPEGSRIIPTEGVVVHASRTYEPELHRHAGSGVPRTRIERSVIDAAAWTSKDRRACGVLCASVQQRLVTPEALIDALAAAGPIRRRHLLGLTLGDIEGGAHSLLEIDFGQLGIEAGIGRPRRQVERKDASGKRRYIDVEFDFFDAEVDGALHLLPANYWNDQYRHNELLIAGSRTLHFSTVAVRVQRELVISQLRRADEAFRR